MKKLIAAVLTGALLAGAAACTDEAAGASSDKHHAKSHKTTSRRVTAKAHTEGTGRYFLTLKGSKHPASVTKRTFKRCDVGDRYPACADA